MVTKQDIRFYRDHGYLVVEDVVDDRTMAMLHRITGEIIASAAELTESTDIIDLEDSHSAERPRVRRIKRPHKAHPFYREFAGYPGFMAALAPLLGPDIRLRAGGKINMKSAGHGAPVEWHQDWAFYPHTNDDVLAIGVLMNDVDLDNGPLLVMPGTHKGPIFDHHADGAFCGAIDPETCGLDFAEAVPLTGRAGSITIHHGRLVHGSAMNRSERDRRLLLYEYTAADAWPLAGVEPLSDYDEFNGRMVLGEPTIAPRMEAVPVRMPFPRAIHQGSIYENQRTLSHRYFGAHARPEAVPAQ